MLSVSFVVIGAKIQLGEQNYFSTSDYNRDLKHDAVRNGREPHALPWGVYTK